MKNKQYYKMYSGMVSGRNGSIIKQFKAEQTVIQIRLDGMAEIRSAWDFPNAGSPECGYPYTADELLNAGRDHLAEAVLGQGEPDWESVSGLLPRLSVHAHGYLSGPASAGGYLIKNTGVISMQGHCREEDQKVLFAPAMLDAKLGSEPATISMLDNWIPVYMMRQRDNAQCLETLFFVSPGDPSGMPVIWVCASWYLGDKPGKSVFSCITEEDTALFEIDPAVFWDAYITAVQYWNMDRKKTCRFDIPEKKLEQTVYAALTGALCTSTGAHAHYGHQQYSAGIQERVSIIPWSWPGFLNHWIRTASAPYGMPLTADWPARSLSRRWISYGRAFALSISKVRDT